MIIITIGLLLKFCANSLGAVSVIDKSFLSESMKKEYKELLLSRIERLG
jgi:hypothetical protein